MDYTFTNMTTSGRTEWAAQHPDTTVVGFGRSKLRAIRHLETGKVERQSAINDVLAIPRDYPVTA